MDSLRAVQTPFGPFTVGLGHFYKCNQLTEELSNLLINEKHKGIYRSEIAMESLSIFV